MPDPLTPLPDSSVPERRKERETRPGGQPYTRSVPAAAVSVNLHLGRWRGNPAQVPSRKRARGLSLSGRRRTLGSVPTSEKERSLAHQVNNEEAQDIGRRQSLFREVNEQIDRLAERFDLLDQVSIICECATTTCSEQIELTRAEYENLRRIPTHFAVLTGHDIPDVARVVAQNERFVTVEVIGGCRTGPART
jgi:hypothetical protein